MIFINHFTLVIFYYLYHRYKFIILTINHFFYIVSILTKQLYKNFELIYKTSRIIDFSIFSKIIFIIALLLYLYTILYSFVIKILYITYLYFIKKIYNSSFVNHIGKTKNIANL